jgi:hypothetical protein
MVKGCWSNRRARSRDNFLNTAADALCSKLAVKQPLPRSDCASYRNKPLPRET